MTRDDDYISRRIVELQVEYAIRQFDGRGREIIAKLGRQMNPAVHAGLMNVQGEYWDQLGGSFMMHYCKEEDRLCMYCPIQTTYDNERLGASHP